MSKQPKPKPINVWVIDTCADTATCERLGDARQLADALGGRVGALIVGPEVGLPLHAHGADHVVHAVTDGGSATRVAATLDHLSTNPPRAILAPGTADGREWAARLCVKAGWRLLSPALLIESRDNTLVATTLSSCGRFCRRTDVAADETVVLTFKSGVAEARLTTGTDTGDIESIPVTPCHEQTTVERVIPPDPRTVDIRHADRLVAGGRGVGSADGFTTLRQLADRIDAGVAASRVAVDLGWIEHDRQVGQTGRTVAPDLYLACGISGASHHLAGMNTARHIIAVNTDVDAPIMTVAHLALVADLHETLDAVSATLDTRTTVTETPDPRTN